MTDSIAIRGLTSADADDVLALDHFSFATAPEQDPGGLSLGALEWGRTFGAYHPDRPETLAGIYTCYDLTWSVPMAAGATTPAAVGGLSWVGVHPDLRRCGVLRSMITHHLQDLRDRGVALAALHASESGIYGRFGYGIASHDVSYTLARGTTFAASAHVLSDADGIRTTTLFDLDDDAVARRLHAIDVDADTLGHVVLPRDLVRVWLHDVPARRTGKDRLAAIVATRDGRDVGAAVFQREARCSEAGPAGVVHVRHLVAHDAAALLALGRRLVELDLMATTRIAGRGLDDPLLAWAGDLRAREVRLGDAVWARPVDVGAALITRGYAAPVDVVLDVTDETCPWNTRRWRLCADEAGRATCEATDAPADLHLPVDAVAPLFTGLSSAAALGAAGLLDERAPGAIAAVGAAFATGVRPIGGPSF